MNISDKSEKKSKGIAFRADQEKEVDESDEDFLKDIALMERQFNELKKKVDRRPRRNAISKQENASKTDDKPSQGKGVQYFECEGYGHIRTECGTYLKKQKKGLTVSWSDEESDTEVETAPAHHVSTLTGVCYSDTDYDDEEVTFEQLASTYKELCFKSEEVCRTNEKQKVIINELRSEKVQLQAKVTSLESEIELLSTNLNNMTKSVKMLNNGTDKLDELLMVGKNAGDSTGIGYQNNQKENSETKFVPAQKKFEPSRIWSHSTPHQKHKGKFNAWKCHYCGKNGHIKPFCYKLYGYPKKKSQTQPSRSKPKKMWKPKASEAAHFRSKGSEAAQAKVHNVKTKPKKEWKPKVVVSTPVSFPNKIVVDNVVGSPKEIIPEYDVKSECVSPSKDRKTQIKMVTGDSEKEKIFGDENKNSASIGNDEGTSKSISKKDESSLGEIVYTVGTNAISKLDSYISSYFAL
jgi:hypothetical protein